MTDESFAFGAFRLVPAARTLLKNDRPVQLGSRALDLLVALIERAGNTVSKDQLMASAWPETHVDDASLRVHIAALRKVLGDGRDGARFITNVPGRGYAFVAPLARIESTEPAGGEVRAPRGDNIPASLTHVIGRDMVIQALSAQMARRRLLTILGSGGIGKTTTGLAVVEAVRATFEDGVWLVDLASVPTPDLLPSALGGAFGIPLPDRSPISGLTAWLRDKHALVMLDNCEHLIDAVASVAEEIIRFVPRVHLLATSREPLRVQGEWRHRLAPLEFPPAGQQESAASALRYPAVQLFAERAAANADEFVLTDDDVPAILEICRRLDGVPLALELAAAHVEAFGIKGLAVRLNDRIPLLIRGRRTAAPRQQTLRAALDWSYDLLPEEQRVILRRLAVFQGEFTLTAAGTIAADGALTVEEVCNGVADLVDKSLITADIGGQITYYRLLDITRTYALQQLHESGELDRVASLHATYFRGLCVRAQEGAATRSRAEWHAMYGRDIGNLRAALLWAFSPTGDAALGVALAAAATEVWLALSLHTECGDWGARAAAQLAAAAGSRDEMMLQSGFGQALTRSRGSTPEARAALTRTLELAQRLGDAEYQLRALFSLWLFALRLADFQGCLERCRQLEDLIAASDTIPGSAVADWAYGQTFYYLGQHREATARLARAQASFPMGMRGGCLVRFGADVVVAMLSYQAVTFWMLGWADRALQAGQEALEEARRVGSPVSLCVALAGPRSTLLLATGRLEEAEHYIDTLIEHARAHSLAPYHSYGVCSKGCVAAARGDLAGAEALLRAGLHRSRDVGYALFYPFFQAELAAVLGKMGRTGDGLVEIDAALRRADETRSFWCKPQLLRVKGDLSGEEEWFVQSLDLAGRQGALAWELQSALSLARLWRERGKQVEARKLVASVYDRFTEGFDTADLRAAREFL